MAETFEEKVQQAMLDPKNLGEMADADRVGTVGNAECGDMVRLWLKFSEKDGKKVIDRASFQSFGCQTAIAVASMATEMLKGKTVDEARGMDAEALSAPLGPLPPMKIHCGQMVEGALRQALEADADSGEKTEAGEVPARGAEREVSSTLVESFTAPKSGGGKMKVVKLDE